MRRSKVQSAGVSHVPPCGCVHLCFRKETMMKKSKRIRRTQVRRSRTIEDLREEAKSTAPSDGDAVATAIVVVFVAVAMAILLA